MRPIYGMSNSRLTSLNVSFIQHSSWDFKEIKECQKNRREIVEFLVNDEI
jgi:hypothetical protein